MDEFFLTFVVPTLLTGLATVLARRQGSAATIVARGAANGNGHKVSTDEWKQFVERDTARDRSLDARMESHERSLGLLTERYLKGQDQMIEVERRLFTLENSFQSMLQTLARIEASQSSINQLLAALQEAKL